MPSQVFNSSGTFTRPSGVTAFNIKAWGGGAGGTANDGGGTGDGGGGGAYAESNLTLSGASYSVTIGSGGSSGVYLGSSATDGDATYFDDGSQLYADGGKSGNPGSGGLGASSIGNVGTLSGGNGTNGNGTNGGVGGASGDTGGGSGDGGVGADPLGDGTPGQPGKLIISWTASQVVFTVQPTNTAGNTTITPAVEAAIEDAAGNIATESSDNITLAIGTNPASGTLSGTLTLAANSGIATFSDLSVNHVGSGYTLTASASGLSTGTSNSFDISGSLGLSHSRTLLLLGVG